MTKDEFIGNYLTKHMKNHGLPYGKAYFNLLEETEKRGELAWKRFLKRYGKMEKEKITAEQFFCLKMAELYAKCLRLRKKIQVYETTPIVNCMILIFSMKS